MTDHPKNFQTIPHTRVTQLKGEAREREDNKGHPVVSDTEDDLMMKLHRMSIGERDDLIDALIG